jgi:hypothetical protein
MNGPARILGPSERLLLAQSGHPIGPVRDDPQAKRLAGGKSDKGLVRGNAIGSARGPNFMRRTLERTAPHGP